MTTTPLPSEGQVHLYGLTLPHAPAELARLGQLLSAGETARATLLKNEHSLNRYIAARGLLREILGGYLGIAAKNVPLAAGEHGKPFLPGESKELCFNLAHSGDHLLLAVTVKRAVGVDLERVIPGKPLEEMARLVFSRQERAQLSRLAPPRQEPAFYRCWVRKEACLKACGRGFSLPGSSFDLSPLDEKAAVMVACCNQQCWQVLDLAVAHPYCAALAVESHSPDGPAPHVVRVDHHSCNGNWL